LGPFFVHIFVPKAARSMGVRIFVLVPKLMV
jgi:hypothetical protein